MCLCVFVYELRIVSMDKILHFMNTLKYYYKCYYIYAKLCIHISFVYVISMLVCVHVSA